MTNSHFWHQFTDMAWVRGTEPFTIDRGEGAYLFDAAGRRYLDASAGLWFCNVGHGRERIADAAREQMLRFASYSTFGDYTNEPIEELANWLAERAPIDGAEILFANGGSEGNDSMIKLVRRFWLAKGKPERRIIVSRHSAYHGGTMGATDLGGIPVDRDGFGELITDTARIPWDSADALEEFIEREGAERVAAFILEPVIAAGGVLFPPEGYLQQVQEICRKYGVLLVADEVVTGFGRAGAWFATERFGIQPDIITCAKGITSGYAPLGALIVGSRVSEPFFDGTVGAFNHGFTYSGNPTAAAIALANIAIMEEERLLDQTLTLIPQLPALLEPLTAHPLLHSVRTGDALMAAVDLVPEAVADDPRLPQRVVLGMREAGVLTRPLVGGQIQFSPPLVAGPDQVGEFVGAVLHGLESARN